MPLANRRFAHVKNISPQRQLLALLIAGLGLLALFINLGWPADWWLLEAQPGSTDRESKPFTPWLASCTTLVTLITAAAAPLRGGVNASKADRALLIANAEGRLNDTARLIFADVAETEKRQKPALSLWLNMTVRAFVVDRSSMPQKLKMVADFRNHERESSGVDWNCGKGVVGIAWKRRTTHFRDLRHPAYVTALSDEAAWRNSDLDLRQGLSFTEANQLLNQPYGAVIAFPVIASDQSEILGVISIDAPPGSEYLKLLVSDDVRRGVQRLIRSSVPEFEAVWESQIC